MAQLCPHRGLPAEETPALPGPEAELSQARKRRRRRRNKAGGTYLGGWGSKQTVARAPPFLPAPGSDRAGPGSPSGRAASLLQRLSRGGCVSPQLCCTDCRVPPNPCSAGTTEEHLPIICWYPGPPAAAVPPQRAPKGQAGEAGRGFLLPRAELTWGSPGTQGSATSTCHIHASLQRSAPWGTTALYTHAKSKV